MSGAIVLKHFLGMNKVIPYTAANRAAWLVIFAPRLHGPALASCADHSDQELSGRTGSF